MIRLGTARMALDRRFWASLALAVVVLVGAAPFAFAQTDSPAAPSPELDEAKAELLGVDTDLVLSKERIEALKKELAEMDGDRSEQNAALIAAAQRVKLAEVDISASEDKLRTLIDQETDLSRPARRRGQGHFEPSGHAGAHLAQSAPGAGRRPGRRARRGARRARCSARCCRNCATRRPRCPPISAS